MQGEVGAVHPEGQRQRQRHDRGPWPGKKALLNHSSLDRPKPAEAYFAGLPQLKIAA